MTDEEFQAQLAVTTDGDCWRLIEGVFRERGVKLEVRLIETTPLPLIMKQITAEIAAGTLKIKPRWLPVMERAFHYVQTRN